MPPHKARLIRSQGSAVYWKAHHGPCYEVDWEYQRPHWNCEKILACGSDKNVGEVLHSEEVP
ncbi:UNVERIFIED_CONTAM: hypothetical protein Sradi_0163200 [Sesamum radiatum]|uniref:Uncharacterized protein n=1 Tax=Sesamum radiatum TaxID=300843 RepID=A0AAW2WL83_SESRA